jgi:hypothetical protein
LEFHKADGTFERAIGAPVEAAGPVRLPLTGGRG